MLDHFLANSKLIWMWGKIVVDHLMSDKGVLPSDKF